MKTEVSSISTARRRVTVDVPPGEVDRIFDRVLREYRRSLSVPGFRKGKAPMAVVRQRVGSSLGSTVAESIVDTYAQKAIESEGVAPIAGSVAMELDDGADALPAASEGEGYTFTLTADVLPEIDLDSAPITGLKIARPTVELEPHELEDEMSRIRESLGKLVPVTDRASREEDFVEVDIEGSELGGEPLLPKKTQVVRLGQEGNLPEFERGLAGLNADESFTFEVRYPEDSPDESLRGKVLYFKGEVRAVMERVVPELNDEAAARLGDDIGSLAELREKVREALLARKEAEADRVARRRLLDRLLDTHPCDAPPTLIDRELRDRLERLGRHLAAQGVDPEKIEVDWKKVVDEQREEADRTVRESLLLDAIAARQSLSVTPDELDAAVSEIASGAKEKPAVVRKKLQKAGSLEALESQLLRGKCLDWLIDEANIV